MSLQNWASNGWLRPHKTSAQEIENLLAIVDRDLADAEGNISDDWRFPKFGARRPGAALAGGVATRTLGRDLAVSIQKN